MIQRVTAIEFVRPMSSGRTSPLLVNCERADGTVVAVVAKFSGFCEQGEAHLVREIIGACLAGDLGLPLPEPFLVEIPDGFSELVSDTERRTKIQQSAAVAFGSRLVTGGYSTWTPDTHLTEGMRDTAFAVFAFDAIIQNVDRRSENPNCFVRGDEIRIFDHDLAFAHDLVLGWRGPWEVGGLNWIETKGRHIFRSDLKKGSADVLAVQACWNGLPESRFDEYAANIPAEWENANATTDSALALLRTARARIGDCMTEIRRVLS